MDIIELNRRSAQATVEIVATITAADLDRPTPCTGWAVRDLLAHQIVQNHGFARAAAGAHSELADWAPGPLGPDPVAEYGASVDAVLAALATPGVLDGKLWLPEIRGGGPFPAPMAFGFLFVDYVVHGWDFARSLGVAPNVADDLATAALPMALQVPDAPDVRGPGMAFLQGVDASAGASDLDRVVAILGRSPEWSA